MLTSSSNPEKQTLKIKKQTNGRKLSQEISMEDHEGSSSSIAVPFTWESQPGTPKIKYFRENPIPPLTPPPSFFYKHNPRKTPSRNHSKTNYNLLNMTGFFSKRPPPAIKNIFPASPAASSSSSSTSYSNQSSPLTAVSSRRKSLDSSRTLMVDEDECESPVSTLCFRIGRRGGGDNVRSWGMAKVFLGADV